jgi:hypothetical protein
MNLVSCSAVIFPDMTKPPPIINATTYTASTPTQHNKKQSISQLVEKNVMESYCDHSSLMEDVLTADVPSLLETSSKKREISIF